MNFGQFRCLIAEIILYHRYFISKLSYPITGPRLVQCLCPSGYKGTASTLAIHIKHQNLNVVLFFKKSPIKSECLMIIICKETSLKGCGSLRSGNATTRVNSKMDHVDNQIILKLPNVQIFS